jgi:hypothetical protein
MFRQAGNYDQDYLSHPCWHGGKFSRWRYTWDRSSVARRRPMLVPRSSSPGRELSAVRSTYSPSSIRARAASSMTSSGSLTPATRTTPLGACAPQTSAVTRCRAVAATDGSRRMPRRTVLSRIVHFTKEFLGGAVRSISSNAAGDTVMSHRADSAARTTVVLSRSFLRGTSSRSATCRLGRRRCTRALLSRSMPLSWSSSAARYSP